MKSSVFFLAFASIITLFSLGCNSAVLRNQSIMSPPDPEDQKTIAQLTEDFQRDKVLAERLYWKAVGVPELAAPASSDVPAAAPPDDHLRYEALDKYAKAHFAFYDVVCRRFQSDFMGRSAAVTSAGKITALALTTAAAVTTPLRASQLLSGIGSGFTGATEVLRQEFLGNIAEKLISQQITLSMKQRADQINAKLAASTVPTAADGYNTISSLDSALHDYFAACSIPYAVALLSQNVGIKPDTDHKDE